MIRLRRRQEDPQTEDLNMTPMIDVVFQLLIFFMLTMQFKEVEGKLLSQLPKDAGPLSAAAPPREEVRIAVCAGGSLDQHLGNRGRHDQEKKDGSACRVFVEKHAIGELASTELAPGRGTSNKAVYRAAGEKLRGLLDALGQAKIAVILDADPEVPYEHIIGIVDACKASRIDTVEFVGNARLEKYYR